MRLAQWLLGMSGMLTVAVLLGLLARRLRVPLTVVLAVIGFGGGVAARAAGWQLPLAGDRFEETVVFGFLPVLVFAAVLGLSVRMFVRNLAAIVGLAVLALVIATALVGTGVHLILGVPVASALLFGALISATDPVAVVAVFEQVGVPRRLLTLVEGESLLNDGVAIVLFEILLVAALGGMTSPGAGLVAFVGVFFGGAAVGVAVGFVAAMALPWLDRLSAAALSVGVAYGSFVLADDIFGFSGVMATVAAGLVVGGFAPSRASASVRGMWAQLWSGLDYIANALLFLLIGLAVDATLLVQHAGAIALAIVLVLVARALAVFPVVAALERFAAVPRVGKRNEAVLVWGGLRGAVALALALALPNTLAQRDLFVAMTAGVVLATLVLNATTIGMLVRWMGLAQPSRTDRLLTETARLSGIAAARRRLTELEMDDEHVQQHLARLEDKTRRELDALEIDDDEQEATVYRRGLHVERDTYQHLSDAGLLPPAAARAVLREVDDQIDALTAGGHDPAALRRDARRGSPWLVKLVLSWMPQPPGENPQTLAYAEASARRLAARRTVEALDTFCRLPAVDADVADRVRAIFAAAEVDAVDSLDRLDVDDPGHRLRQAQADALATVAAQDELQALADAGLLPRRVAEDVDREVRGELGDPYT